MAKQDDDKKLHPTVARMWAQRFPDVRLTNFLACRTDGSGNSVYKGVGCTRDVHHISFAGKIDVLLRLGVIDHHMVPLHQSERSGIADPRWPAATTSIQSGAEADGLR